MPFIQVTHGSNYMLANNRNESDRVVRKRGGSLKRVTLTNERGNLHSRDHLKQLLKGSFKNA